MTDIFTACGKDFEIRRSRRRKNIAVGIDPCGIYFIACPFSCSLQKIEGLIGKDICKYILRIEKKKKVHAAVHKYSDGERFLFRGSEFPLVWTETKSASAIELRDGKFFIAAEVSGREYAAFESWYRRALYDTLREVMPRWTKAIRVNPRAVHIKTVRSVWGSCSAKASLTFCTRLALAEPAILEYVVVHELCHMLYMNHSAQFWEKVSEYIPDYKDKRNLLNKNAQIYKWW